MSMQIGQSAEMLRAHVRLANRATPAYRGRRRSSVAATSFLLPNDARGRSNTLNSRRSSDSRPGRALRVPLATEG